ncbi:MAG: LCP family protein [Acidimicrobiales bacterium]
MVTVLALLIAGTLVWGYAQFRSIERVELTEVLASGNGTNYLIVGSDTREGVSADDPDAGAFLGDDSVGGPERSDTILILRVDSDGARTLSVPRDLWVTISETGERARINAAFNGGPGRLIATLRDQLQIPIHHYLEVDFVSFASMVDALGGITIDFPHPAFDTHSGLNVTETGPQVLSGTQALAYVRSRFYTEVIDGRDVPQGTGDIGRVERQQAFLSAITGEIGSTYNPFTLARVGNTLADGMRIDDDLSFPGALNLLRRMRGMDPTPNSLPTTGFVTAGGAQVLRLVQPDADAVLAGFGSSGSQITG